MRATTVVLFAVLSLWFSGCDDLAQQQSRTQTTPAQPLGKPSKPDPDTGGSPQTVLGEFSPTCLSLFQKYPSQTGGTEVVTDDAVQN
jgi:hypothetical protein